MTFTWKWSPPPLRSSTVTSASGSAFFIEATTWSGWTIEKVINKYQQLAKDAQSSGDPVLIENYLQHADHYSRRLAELNDRSTNNSDSEKNNSVSDTSIKDVSKN